MKKILPLFLLLCSSNAYALEVDKAYGLIPHRQTPFLLQQSNIPNSEAAKVARMLSLAELAMVARVSAIKDGAIQSGYFAQVDPVLWQLEILETTGKLDAARQHVVAAIRQQRTYFELSLVNETDVSGERRQLIQESHRHLIVAYNILLQAYPQETRHNKQAFFDYLCALDFI